MWDTLYKNNYYCRIFLISVAGAIAGIADQPIRGFQEVGSDPVTPMSPSQRARGVISGVGRGLVGAVIKPLGGAAEFVAQAGQGKYPTLAENFGKALCAAFKQYSLLKT